MSSYIGVFVAVVVGACAVLASTGFRGRQSVVGIDLGTTYSVIGVNEGGKVHIIKGADGDPLIPSVVSFLEGGSVAVGREADALLEENPTNTIYGAKRFIGRGFSDDAVLEEAAEHHFSLVHRPDDLSGAWFRIGCPGHPEAVSPQTVGSHVLGRLLELAANYLGHKQVDKAVIAVPAKFDERQRQATVEAFRLAGLKSDMSFTVPRAAQRIFVEVIRTLEEPTAAALAFGLHRKPDVHHILVYDFGGGTLDVSLLFVSEGSVEVVASDGDDNLGGADFDQCLARVLEEKLTGRVATLAKAEEGSTRCNFPAPICTPHNLYPMAEALKRRLTYQESASLECMSPPPGHGRPGGVRGGRAGSGVASHAGGEEGAEGGGCKLWEESAVVVTRAEYKQRCDGLFRRGMAPVARLLGDLELGTEDIDEVVMVGGMTRTPWIRELLKDHLDMKRLNVEIDPDVVVAHGAASVAH